MTTDKKKTAAVFGAIAAFGATALLISTSAHGDDKKDVPKYAGALTFAPDGTLFVGDNISSAVFAYKTALDQPEAVDTKAPPLEVEAIDNRIAPVIHGKVGQIEINGMAVHPSTHEVFLSVSRLSGGAVTPAVVKVSLSGKITEFKLNSSARTEFKIKDAPTLDQHFVDRANDWPMAEVARVHEKAKTPMRSMTIVDMKFHNDELYIAGISNEEFASTLRRVTYPFSDEIAETKIKIYHDAHAQYETRAPIRAMSFATVDGKDTLVAAYTCSPLVLIPIEDLKNGAQVEGHVIGDMGNGQPLSMFTFKFNGADALFVTNATHDPRIIPVASLQNAKVFTQENTTHHGLMDTTGLPEGVVGMPVMFAGASLHADVLSDKFIVSLNRNIVSGKINLEALPSFFPVPVRLLGLENVWSEFDFPTPKTK